MNKPALYFILFTVLFSGQLAAEESSAQQENINFRQKRAEIYRSLTHDRREQSARDRENYENNREESLRARRELSSEMRQLRESRPRRPASD